MSPPRNRLLSGLSTQDLALLQSQLELCRIEKDQVLEQPQKPIEHVYFPESGVASLVAVGSANRRIEVGPFGREGMSGIAVVLGTDRSPHETRVQVSGQAHRVTAGALREVMRQSPSLQVRLLRYVQAFSVQAAHSTLANGNLTIEQRLARWLMMLHDRIDGDELPLTHDFLALMLSVRRAGVTIAVHMLEGRGLIRATRGLIRILDRQGLKALAQSSYGIAEAEYRRLLEA